MRNYFKKNIVSFFCEKYVRKTGFYFILARLLFAPSGSRDLTFACRYLGRVVSVLKRKKILSFLFIFEAKDCLCMIKVYAKVVLL